MKIGDLLYPRTQTGAQLHIPFWGSSVAIVVDTDYCVDCDFDEQTPVEERLRWVILTGGELLFMTPYLLEQCYECG
tara:strand:- start:65 stop:292 length:228 start_codon:yes stop_codon:yes gene_type:complete